MGAAPAYNPDGSLVTGARIFTPRAATVGINAGVTGTSSQQTLDGVSPQVALTNYGANRVRVRFGANPIALVTDFPLLPNTTVVLSTGMAAMIALITETSTSTVSIIQGTGQ